MSEQFSPVDEVELEHFTSGVLNLVANARVELCIAGVEPVPCEVVIPVNIIRLVPETVVSLGRAPFRWKKSEASSEKCAGLEGINPHRCRC